VSSTSGGNDPSALDPIIELVIVTCAASAASGWERRGAEREASSASCHCPSSISSRLLSISSAATCAGPTRRPDTPISTGKVLESRPVVRLEWHESGDRPSGIRRPPAA
jgi:hypothetical protein